MKSYSSFHCWTAEDHQQKTKVPTLPNSMKTRVFIFLFQAMTGFFGYFQTKYREAFAVFLDNVRVRFGVFENLIAETVPYEIYESLARNRADAWARGRERDDEFAVFTHDAERPNGAVERLVFGLQDAAFVRVKKRAGNFFFGVVGAVIVFKNKATGAVFLRVVNCAELTHHTVFVRFAEFFHDFGREQGRFPEALPAEGAAELAGGALFF